MKRNLLVQLTAAVFLPSFGAFLLAWVGFCQFEKTMESLAGSYAQNLARGAAARLESAQWDLRTDGSWRPNQFRSRIAGLSDIIADDINIPGMFAIFDKDGNLVYGASDLPVLADLWDRPVMTHEPFKIHSPDGNHYTVSVYPILQRNLYVVAAVSWNNLLGPMVTLATLWPFLMGLLGLAGIFAVLIMWQKVILPLKELEEEVSILKWGEEIPASSAPEAVDELQKLRDALVELANSAIDKEKLSRSYVNDIVKVQEEERSRISREIHDGPLQDVTALIQRLRLLSMDIDSSSESAKRVSEAESVAMTSVREMRELCNNLTPPWLDLGLAQAVTELSERLGNQLGIKIYLDLEDVPGLPRDVSMSFFRVVQEAVNNSAHHAGASFVKINLYSTDEKLCLVIEDDGSGFDVPDNIAELRVKGHRGLSNMQERMSLVGGTLNITSSPGEGTIISCELPYQTVQ